MKYIQLLHDSLYLPILWESQVHNGTYFPLNSHNIKGEEDTVPSYRVHSTITPVHLVLSPLISLCSALPT